MALAPDEPLSASDRAYDWTRSKILDGSFSGGSMISESDVSEPLGISRTPVREAFLRLEHDGTLKVYPKRGALIVPITAKDMRDVLEARLLVEPWAVSVVASSGGRESLGRNASRAARSPATCGRPAKSVRVPGGRPAIPRSYRRGYGESDTGRVLSVTPRSPAAHGGGGPRQAP